MNLISVEGSTKAKRDLAYELVDFAISKLMPRMKTLDIDIQYTKLDDAQGYCMAEDKRVFYIEIDPRQTGDDLKTCIFHEMVHVAQYAQGRLHVDEKANYTTADEYLSLWYEKEAYSMQETLLKMYKGEK